MTAVDALPALGGARADLARELVTWLETGVRRGPLLADDVAADLSVPQWRVEARGPDAVYRLREDRHPFPGTVAVEALLETTEGFLIQFEERWQADGQRWYCREMIHCSVDDDRVSAMAIYCTGDWDEATQRRHAEQVRQAGPRS